MEVIVTKDFYEALSFLTNLDYFATSLVGMMLLELALLELSELLL